jgi:DNA-binding FrmR family transcriptional regulator
MSEEKFSIDALFEASVDEVKSTIKQDIRNSVRATAFKVLGIETNTWGDVVKVEDAFIQRIFKRISPEEIDAFEEKVKEVLQQKIATKRAIEQVSMRLFEQVMRKHVMEMEAYAEKKILNLLKASIDEKIKKTFAEFYVAEQIMNSSKRDPYNEYQEN